MKFQSGFINLGRLGIFFLHTYGRLTIMVVLFGTQMSETAPVWVEDGLILRTVLLEMGSIVMRIVLAGRGGAGIASELGTMQIPEQVNALPMSACIPGIRPLSFNQEAYMQSGVRKIKKMAKAKPTMEGAGVHLHRAFGFQDTDSYDPFLLLDDFRGDNPDDYLAGFPWHPHRGIETITYMLAGSVEHGDSLGNSGVIEAGGVQWMTAGSGIIHQEMPKPGPDGRMYGFQLWANLAASEKMTQPRYQEFSADQIPAAAGPDGATAKVICGSLWEVEGPVHGIGINPVYVDMYIPPGLSLSLPIAAERSAFAYVYEGSVCFSEERDPFSHPTEAERWHDTEPPEEAENRTLVLFDQGRQIKLSSGEQGARFLLVSGVPLREPVAWYGPIVMNTRDQLKQAFNELDQGTFLLHTPGGAGRPGQRP